MKMEWVDGFEIRVNIENSEAVISANREGPEMKIYRRRLTRLEETEVLITIQE